MHKCSQYNVVSAVAEDCTMFSWSTAEGAMETSGVFLKASQKKTFDQEIKGERWEREFQAGGAACDKAQRQKRERYV